MQKSFDQMNVRIHHAVSGIEGKTGLAIVEAIMEGHGDPVVLAKLRDPRCQKNEKQIPAEPRRSRRECGSGHSEPSATFLDSSKPIRTELSDLQRSRRRPFF